MWATRLGKLSCLRGPIQNWLYSHRRWPETGNLGVRKKSDFALAL